MITEYKNKLFSVLGDSISTFEGVSEPEFAAFYDNYNKLLGNIYSPKQTWWGIVIDTLGGELLVNNSISGSTVTWHPSYEISSYACSDERRQSCKHCSRLQTYIFLRVPFPLRWHQLYGACMSHRLCQKKQMSGGAILLKWRRCFTLVIVNASIQRFSVILLDYYELVYFKSQWLFSGCLNVLHMWFMDD